MEDKIYRLISYYYPTEEEVERWYTRPHAFFEVNGEKKSPREMIELGKAEEVLAWLKLHLTT